MKLNTLTEARYAGDARPQDVPDEFLKALIYEIVNGGLSFIGDRDDHGWDEYSYSEEYLEQLDAILDNVSHEELVKWAIQVVAKNPNIVDTIYD